MTLGASQVEEQWPRDGVARQEVFRVSDGGCHDKHRASSPRVNLWWEVERSLVVLLVWGDS